MRRDFNFSRADQNPYNPAWARNNVQRRNLSVRGGVSVYKGTDSNGQNVNPG